MKSLGVLMRAHARAKSLDIALSEWLRYRDLGIDVRVHVLADRPNFMVERVLSKYRDRLFGLRYSPFPLVSAKGESFMEAANLQLLAFEHGQPPDFYALADDDRWFARPQIDKVLPAALANDDVDLWYAQSLFLWDRPDQVNYNRHHDSVALFRARRGDRFPTDRIIQATAGVHDDAIVQGRVSDLGIPLLDYGTMEEAERRRVHAAFWDTGAKKDSYVASIIEPPKLSPLLLVTDDLWTKYTP